MFKTAEDIMINFFVVFFQHETMKQVHCNIQIQTLCTAYSKIILDKSFQAYYMTVKSLDLVVFCTLYWEKNYG